MNPKLFWLITAIFLVSSSRAEGQQPTKIPRIGFVSGTAFQSPGADFEAFRQGLRDLGYLEGKNILIEYRYLATERTQDIVAELIQLKVDILVLRSQPSIRAVSKRLKQSRLSWSQLRTPSQLDLWIAWPVLEEISLG